MPRLKHSSLLFIAAIAPTLGLTGFSALAQMEADRLKSVEQEIKDSEAEKNRLIARQETVTRELATLRTDMTALAKAVQDQEAALTELEARLKTLEAAEAELKARLGVRDEQLQRVAMALQRLALRPNASINLSPLNPDDAVRTAILLKAAVPTVQSSARELESELGELFAVRKDVEDQQQKVALAAAGLIDKRRSLEQKEVEKAKLQIELTGATDAATAKLQKLAAEAADLKDLVAKVMAERAKRAQEREAARVAAEAKRQAELAAAAKAAKPSSSRIVLKPPPGIILDAPEPASDTKAPESQVASLPPPTALTPGSKPAELRPFSQARGTMPTPAMGSLKKRYGEASDEPGGQSKGIVIASRSGGQVVAPFDGTVAFAGPFRGYGLLLIIEHSEGYHTLLAGLGRIDCVLDQRVFAGEPVGVMSSQGASDLYVELRQNGQPVNPLPWLESRTGKSSG